MKKRNFEELKALTFEAGGDYGLNHSQRLIKLVEMIAQGRPYDRGVIEFCAYVHDFGAFSKYAQAGKDHVVRSMEVLPEIMDGYDFTGEEKKKISETVANHHKPGVFESFEAVLFRDADAVDFLGVIGIARDMMRSGKDINKAVDSIIRHREKLPAVLHEEAAKQLAKIRMEETDHFLSRLREEHFLLLPESEG
ncbi:MAG: hypothetical protein BWY11_01816 [Firmicutes bacterium ADurb.Bin182]|nr:MAG: hypothetical protein BWY11_01816 [Firmicutes bacterium ADurb.Bin182]